ncbi:UNVERIFIED_CONTAM: SAG-related sequence SRS22E [Hammondia hammondi]|eukprot:XP_008887536.1 SAG-related sequence SRS22E [Hammondia hammondi]
MKFSLLTLGTLALSAQQASAVLAENADESTQQPQDTNCKHGKSLNFNVTQAAQSIVFTCDTDVPILDPAFNATTPQIYAGNEAVNIFDILPSATLEDVTTAAAAAANAALVANTVAKKYNFTVPNLPSEELELSVHCRDKVPSSGSSKHCKVTFHVTSSAVHPFVAASAVIVFIASLLHFA